MKYSFIIGPDTYSTFDSEEEQIDKCKEWGLLSEKAAKMKPFYYKGNGLNVTCKIVGYVDRMTAVIGLPDQQLHCIHPSYLKEMQASTYTQRAAAVSEDAPESADAPPEALLEEALSSPEAAVPAVEIRVEEPKAAVQKKEKAKKEKAPKLQLPDEKVKMTATVKEFTTVPNHFSDNDDEVVIYESVALVEPETEIGEAWSSHSATLKKLELEIGDMITFEAKIVAKKLTRHPVPYKINNPAKIQKKED
ncbi:hypothetical protein [Paenibacillus lutrae]|uniref:Uncharacterized protein n=1 Tax=Paenibacillus lutrae TaxID=2078573 RepID=A0A7X3FLD3_9BACL|nr:hypothetical protein [Paenibacillus lutrae]MVP01841.1 hypothetical protein [Paenibacillus lutrae]